MTKICVPECEGGNGNNVLIPPPSNALYKYDFVLNNYTKLEVCQLIENIPKIAKRAILNWEVGEEGTPHLQCYISLKKKERITGLQKSIWFARCSMRAVRNEVALIHYCRKNTTDEGKEISGCEFWDPMTINCVHWEFGFPKPIKVIEKLRPFQQKILDIYMSEPDDRTVNWFWEPIGNIGKSAFIKYMRVKHDIIYGCGGKYADIMNLVYNQNMDECRGAFFNIPRANEGKISYASLESIKDGLVCNTKFECGCKVFNPVHLFVFANFPPDSPELLSSDRWNIVELGESELGL